VKKILIFGAGGMAGHVCAEFLSGIPDYEVMTCARRPLVDTMLACDVTDRGAVEQVLKQTLPDIVINCVGMLVKDSEKRLDQAILVNGYFPHMLAHLGGELNFKLIHISTDCVFSGKKGGYAEEDFRDGDTPYARTKALGEVMDSTNLTIRTSIIGPEIKSDGSGLCDWFMKQSGTINGYSQAFWSGVTTVELAKAIRAFIQQDITGLYQLTMPEKISKYDLLKLFKNIWKREDLVIESADEYFCDKSMVCARTDFDYKLPASYSEILTSMKCWMNDHQATYHQASRTRK